MSWLEDFTDGETIWRQLMSAPSLESWLEAERELSDRDIRLIVLYHAIVEKQEAGEWKAWTRPDHRGPAPG
jgi:hypothetical protein